MFGTTALAHAESYTLDITRHEVPLPHLPDALDGLRIAHLTDLHRGACTPDSLLQRTIETVQREDPDLVVLTGDYLLDDKEHAVVMARMLGGLRPRLGVAGCLGNHDYWGDNGDFVSANLSQWGKVRMLRNTAEAFAPGLFLAGIEDTLRGGPDIRRIEATVPDDVACVFLTHNPVGVRMIERRPWLALAGHTHGGQIRLPGVPPYLPPGLDNFPVIAGWGEFGAARLYVSRGIGCTGLPLRLRCAPELAIFTLRAT
jgi:predicted MPP superfamily phosphohydrolase